jgi:nicotinamidase-related amidase
MFERIKRKLTVCLDRLSGLWGPQTPLGLFLMENEITTLFFGGVNADQCVVCSGLLQSPAFYRGSALF